MGPSVMLPLSMCCVLPHPHQLYTEFSGLSLGITAVARKPGQLASCSWASLGLRRRMPPHQPHCRLLAAACFLQLSALTAPLPLAFVSSSSLSHHHNRSKPPVYVSYHLPFTFKKAPSPPYAGPAPSSIPAAPGIIALWIAVSPSTRELLWVGLRLCWSLLCPWQGLGT